MNEKSMFVVRRSSFVVCDFFRLVYVVYGVACANFEIHALLREIKLHTRVKFKLKIDYDPISKFKNDT